MKKIDYFIIQPPQRVFKSNIRSMFKRKKIHTCHHKEPQETLKNRVDII